MTDILEEIHKHVFEDHIWCDGCDYLKTTANPFATHPPSPPEHECLALKFTDCPGVQDVLAHAGEDDDD